MYKAKFARNSGDANPQTCYLYDQVYCFTNGC